MKKGDDGHGRACASARDGWMWGDVGRSCSEGSASGQFLRNRIEIAFIAGFDAGVAYAKGGSREEGA